MKRKKRESKLTNQVDALIREFESTSKESVEQTKRIQQTKEKLNKSLSNLQDSLDYLRIAIKYQVFDLEATRRENEYLRRLLAEDGDRECTS